MHVAVQQLPAPLMSQVPDAHEALLVQAAPLASAVPLPGAATHAVPPALQLAPDPAQSVAELVQVVLQLIPSAAQLKPPLQAAVVLPHVPVPVQEVKVCRHPAGGRARPVGGRGARGAGERVTAGTAAVAGAVMAAGGGPHALARRRRQARRDGSAGAGGEARERVSCRPGRCRSRRCCSRTGCPRAPMQLACRHWVLAVHDRCPSGESAGGVALAEAARAVGRRPAAPGRCGRSCPARRRCRRRSRRRSRCRS